MGRDLIGGISLMHMSKTLKKGRAMALLLILAVGCLCAHLLQYNWTLHARLNLLLRGHVCSQLKPPGSGKELPAARPPELVSEWVYEGGRCVGYLNPGGHFVPISDVAVGWNAKSDSDMATTIVLFYSKWLLLLTSLVVCATFSWRAYTQRRRASST